MKPHPPMISRPRRLPTRRRGSVLITALLFSAIIAISLTSYLRLALNSLNLADRSFYQNAAANLAEVGIESAMYCYNHLDEVVTPASAWGSGWTIATDNSVTSTLTGFTLGPGVTGQVKIYCSNYTGAGSNPMVIAKSIVTFARGGGTLEKFMEVTLRRRSLWANGLVARDGMTWSGGNVLVDSWLSDPDSNSATAAVSYSAAVRRANGRVGTLSSTDGAINLGNGNVYGYVATAGGNVTYGPTAVVSGTFPGSGGDTARITTDFDASFPTITQPSPSATNLISSSITTTTSLPGGSDTAASDGYYYYNFGSGAAIDLNGGGKNLTITGKVVLLFNNHATVPTITLGGNAYLSIAANAKLRVYTNGNVDLGGNGAANANADPSSLMILGTSTTSQTISVTGNGQLIGAVYAPTASVTMSGGGSSGNVMGSVVGRTISMTGGSAFHYDESLVNASAGNPFGIVQWRELQTAAERNTANTTQLSF